MRKNLITLIILSLMATVLLSTAYARKITKIYKLKESRITSDPDSVSGDSLIQFAQTLIGTPYLPKSSDPLHGFDCSGFVNYVFKNFNLNVPRSSCEFINVGEKIRLEDAKPGDIILFTSPTNNHRIGHVGIVLYNGADDFRFIHSTSGKEYAVTITSMDENYRRRFVQIIRVLKLNDTPADSQVMVQTLPVLQLSCN
jgi:lipoprotein Spr